MDKDAAARILLEIADIVEPTGTGLGMIQEGQMLRRRANTSKNGSFNLLVAGTFSNGKSTLVNALLGAEVVLTGAVPTTAVSTRLNYSDSHEIIVHPRVGHPYAIDSTTYQRDYDVAQKESAVSWEEVDHIAINGPYPLLAQGLTLIDTPGLAENRQRTGLALEYLPHASAIILVIHAKQPLSRDEMDFIALLGAGKLTHVFFVVNQIDLISKEELSKLETYMQRRLQRYFLDEDGSFDVELFRKRLFFTDSQTALDAINNVNKGRQSKEVKSTGIQSLQEALIHYRKQEHTPAANLHTIIPLLANIYVSAKKTGKHRMETLAHPLHALETRATDCEAKLQRMELASADIQMRISEFGNVAKHQIYSNLLEFIQAMKTSWPEDVQTLDLNEVTNVNIFSAKFNESERKRFADAFYLELQRYIQQKLIQWARQLPPIFQASVEDLLNDLQRDLHAFQFGMQDIAAMFSGSSSHSVPRGRQVTLLAHDQDWFTEVFSHENIIHLIRPLVDNLLNNLFEGDAYKPIGLTVGHIALEFASVILGKKGHLYWLFVTRVGGDLIAQIQQRYEFKQRYNTPQEESLRLDEAYADLGKGKTDQLKNAIKETLAEQLHDPLFEKIHTTLVEKREVIFAQIEMEFQRMGREVGQELQVAIDDLRTTQKQILQTRQSHNFSLEQEEARIQHLQDSFLVRLNAISQASLKRTLHTEEIDQLSQQRAIFLERTDAPPELVPILEVLPTETLTPTSVESPDIPEVKSEHINQRLMTAVSIALGLGEFNQKNDELAAVSERLASMIGMETVKQRILELMDFQAVAHQRKQAGLTIGTTPSLHLVFTGNPGTGKTSVAEIIGQIYKRLNLLRGGHMHPPVTRADLVGAYRGHTEQKIREVIKQARDGVLFIDEAYTLTRSGDPNDFGLIALEELMGWMESLRGQLAVVVAGYPKQMEDFLHANPGLMSRFPSDNVIHFPDYSPAELLQILEKILHDAQYTLSETAVSQLERVIEGIYIQRDENFGNAREMRNLADTLIRRQASRVNRTNLPVTEPIQPDDINTYYQQFIAAAPDNDDNVDAALREINNLIGLGEVKETFKRLVARARYSERLKEPIRADTLNMVFRGPPGTGKTTVAEQVGKVLHALGFLRSGELIVTDRSALIGDHIGASEKKTQEILSSAKDKVLFIDEAYSLYVKDSPRDYGRSVINQLTGFMDQNRDRVVVILAGYPDEMDEMLAANPGLRDRFRIPVDFRHYTQDELLAIGHKMASDDGFTLTPETKARISTYLERKRAASSRQFGNARAVRVLLDEMKDRLAERVINIQDEAEFHKSAKRFLVEDVPPLPDVPIKRSRDIVIIKQTEEGATRLSPLQITMLPPAADRAR